MSGFSPQEGTPPTLHRQLPLSFRENHHIRELRLPATVDFAAHVPACRTALTEFRDHSTDRLPVFLRIDVNLALLGLQLLELQLKQRPRDAVRSSSHLEHEPGWKAPSAAWHRVFVDTLSEPAVVQTADRLLRVSITNTFRLFLSDAPIFKGAADQARTADSSLDGLALLRASLASAFYGVWDSHWVEIALNGRAGHHGRNVNSLLGDTLAQRGFGPTSPATAFVAASLLTNVSGDAAENYLLGRTAFYNTILAENVPRTIITDPLAALRRECCQHPIEEARAGAEVNTLHEVMRLFGTAHEGRRQAFEQLNPSMRETLGDLDKHLAP